MDSNAHSTIEIRIECLNLPDLDTFSKSDPLVKVSLEEKGYTRSLGNTEEILNNLNPRFRKSFELKYYFEEIQRLTFQVIDVDDNTSSSPTGDNMGWMFCDVGEVVAAPGSCLVRPLLSSRNGKRVLGKGNRPSLIKVRFVEVGGGDANSEVVMRLSGMKLPKMDFFGASDPFCEIFRVDGHEWTFVQQTEVISKTLNPKWKVMNIPMTKLCRGDKKLPIKFVVWDHNKNGKHDLIGSFTTTVVDIFAKDARSRKFTLHNEHKSTQAKREKARGDVYFEQFDVITHPSFLQFIQGGLQINMMVAIDFTGSNGNPQSRSSLHYNPTPGNPSSVYAHAIRSVGNILQNYDHDQLYPSYVFGAAYQGRTYHALPLTLTNNPCCAGIGGILTAYENIFPHVKLSGPTYFAGIIDEAIKAAQAQSFNSDIQEYSVLMIVTDGIINDMDRTIASLVTASTLPLSVIIVGVGNANFEAMDRLDGDDGHLVDHRGYRADRDIVQFVSFNKFRNNPAALASATLAELPGQVQEFARKRNVLPLPPMEEKIDPVYEQEQGDPYAMPNFSQAPPSAPQQLTSEQIGEIGRQVFIQGMQTGQPQIQPQQAYAQQIDTLPPPPAFI